MCLSPLLQSCNRSQTTPLTKNSVRLFYDRLAWSSDRRIWYKNDPISKLVILLRISSDNNVIRPALLICSSISRICTSHYTKRWLHLLIFMGLQRAQRLVENGWKHITRWFQTVQIIHKLLSNQVYRWYCTGTENFMDDFIDLCSGRERFYRLPVLVSGQM